MSERDELESTPNNEVKAVVMAGGRGTRLASITQGLIPKDFVYIDLDETVRGVDLTQAALKKNNLDDITYAANLYLPQYQEALKGTGIKFHYQEVGDGHGKDLHKIIQKEGMTGQYLILPTDVVFSSEDLARLIEGHSEGTLTYGVRRQTYPEMEPNRAMLMRSDTNAIIGNTKTRFARPSDDPDVIAVVTSGIMMIDPYLFEETYSILDRLEKPIGEIDLYRDVNALLAERNRRNIYRGKRSIFNAVEFNIPFIDYGTPERLELARQLFIK